ncbi:MAG TPA: MarR family transcriptional regulator [Azospirillaceae bacterium]|nr:MarR family transcriptional regulator [Azospirillaceae bacterium]
MTDSAFSFRPEDAIALAVTDIVNAMARHSEGVLEEAGLTAPQWTVLLNIAGDENFRDGGREGPAVYSSEIAQNRGLSRPHISATVTELLRKGLVQQADDPIDRRRKLLTVTPAGLALLRRLQPLRQAVNDMLLAHLAPEQRTQLMETLLSLRDRARTTEPLRQPPALRKAC